MTVQVLTSPNVCFCTTWEEQNKRNIALLVKAVSNLSKFDGQLPPHEYTKHCYTITDTDVKRDYLKLGH